MRCRGFLRLGWSTDLEVAREIDADSVVVLAVNMCADRTERSTLLDCAILTDEKVIADACPPLIQMPFMHGFCCDIVIVWHADVMNDDTVRHKAVFKRSELQMCRTNADTRQYGWYVP